MMTELTLNISIILRNTNGVSLPIKKKTLSDCTSKLTEISAMYKKYIYSTNGSESLKYFKIGSKSTKQIAKTTKIIGLSLNTR